MKKKNTVVKQLRTESVSLRFTKDEYKIILAKAKSYSDGDVSKWVRFASLEHWEIKK